MSHDADAYVVVARVVIIVQHAQEPSFYVSPDAPVLVPKTLLTAPLLMHWLGI